jgi:ferredoxin
MSHLHARRHAAGGANVSGRLDKLERLRGLLDPDPLVVYPERCRREVNKDSTCAACVSLCPHDAIDLSPYPHIDLDRCRGCGVCASVCPTGALEVAGVPLQRTAELIGDMLENSDVTDIAFGCRLHQDTEAEGEALVIVPCIGRVSHVLLLAAVSRGATSIRIDASSCADCEQAVPEQWVREEAAIARAALEKAGMPIRISVGSQEDSGSSAHPASSGIRSDEISRRGFLTSILKETASSALVLTGRSLTEQSSGAEVRNHAPQGRVLLADALFRLEGMGAAGITTDSGLITLPCIESGCDGCEDCVKFCPTGALSTSSDDDGTSIVLLTARCSGCGTCADLCLKNVISMSSPVRPMAPESEVVLVSYGRSKCTACGIEFTPIAGEETCRFCNKRRSIFGL